MEQHHMMADIIEVAHRAYVLRLTPGTAGNISMRSRRAGEQGLMISASGVSLGYLVIRQMVPFPHDGTGDYQPSSEVRLHSALYRVRPRAVAILHYHGVWTVLAGEAERQEGGWRPALALPEFSSLAPEGTVAVVPAVQPGSCELARAAAGLARSSGAGGLILRGHGGITWGQSPQQALFNAEALETAAKIDYLTTCQRRLHGC